MSKEAKLLNFDPSGIGNVKSGLFGLPFNFEESEITILPVPWEVTASFGSGSSKAPGRIMLASTQIDLYSIDNPDGWKRGYYMLDISDEIDRSNKVNRLRAKEIIKMEELGVDPASDQNLIKNIDEINRECEEMVQWVYSQSQTLLKRGKKVCLIGGDHSTPLGYYNALADNYGNFSILQIDAHADLRDSFEGFIFSHASIMYNALKIEELEKLVQVGIRDVCEEEIDFINASGKRIKCFAWQSVCDHLFEGSNWSDICEKIISELPDNICISVDVDGMDPSYCPNTGTPVPGGLSFDQLHYLLRRIYNSDKKIIGFDITETGNSDYDANVSARILFDLCNFMK